MSLDVRLILSIVFFVLLIVFILTHKKGRKVSVWKAVPIFYAVMYRTKWGLGAMDKLAKKFPRTLHFLGTSGVVVGFLGMIAICVLVVMSFVDLLAKPEATQAVGVVLPVKADGVFYVPIDYWIISIFIIALIHEFSHGVLARLHNIRVKSSGFAFLGMVIPIIPAAFVEPDEKEMKKRSLKQQLHVFAAGPFSNVLLAILCLGLVIGLAPVGASMIDGVGIQTTEFMEGFPLENSGMQEGEIITAIDGTPTPFLQNLSDVMQTKSPGQTIALTTDQSQYVITLAENPDNQSKAYMGTYLEQVTDIKPEIVDKYGNVAPRVFFWFLELLAFLFMLNLGIGLFNLVPIGPLDGGRMMLAVLLKYMDKQKALKIFAGVSLFFFVIVIALVLTGFFL